MTLLQDLTNWSDDYDERECEQEIDLFAQERNEYFSKHVQENIPCPVCGEKLTKYRIAVDELWHWPGNISPLIGLEVYAAHGAPKGEIHREGNAVHVWIGSGEHREEKLILLLGSDYPRNLLELPAESEAENG